MQKFLINFKYAFNPRKPRLFIRLCWIFFQIIFLRKKPLRYVDLQMGNKCNIRCKHCFANDYEDTAERISPEKFRKVVDQAMALGAVNFSFQGGEPLMYPDLKDYIAAARPDENVISVTTNATMLTGEYCKRLKSWGVDILTISIDDPYIRPVNPIKIMKRAIMADAMGLKVTIGMAVSHGNLTSDFVTDVINWCVQNKFILVLIKAAPSGNWETDKKILLTENDERILKRCTDSSPYVRTDMQSTYWKEECPAGSEILYIKSDGQISGCPFVPIYPGNVKYQSLEYLRDQIMSSGVYKKDRCVAGTGEFLKQKG